MAFFRVIAKRCFLALFHQLDEKAGFPVIISAGWPGAVVKQARDSRFQPCLFPDFPHCCCFPGFSRFDASARQGPVRPILLDMLDHQYLTVPN